MALGQPAPPTATAHGLSVRYYDNDDLTGRSFSGIDRNVDFDWGRRAPSALTDADTFSARWTGKVMPTSSGLHTFYTHADDGVRLWVDGRQLIDGWSRHPATERSGTVVLTAGRSHDIRMEFYERDGAAVARLLWSGPGTSPKVPVPSRQLVPDAMGDGLLVRSLSTSAASYPAGTQVTVKAEVAAAVPTVIPRLAIAARLRGGDAELHFSAKRDVTVGPSGRTFRFSRTFRSPGTYVYWAASYRDGGWANLLPGKTVTIAGEGDTPPRSAPVDVGSTGEEVDNPAPPAGGPWDLAFHDEFEDGTLEARKWSTRYPRAGALCCSNPDNGEAQWYLPRNVVEQNGELQLVARREPSNGFPYSSGLIQSKSAFNFTYGYAEARMWLPRGSGLWPAFWTWPTNERWPPEIDVVEFYGDNRRNVYLTYHAPTGSDESIITRTDWTAGWHTFAIDWRPGSITWYIDGKQVKARRSQDVADIPLYLIANLAVANGSRAPAPTASTPSPSRLRIDWIRVWKQP
jgi:hypothetical protein